MRIRGGRERRLRFAIRLGNRQVSEPAGSRASARRSAAPKRDTWLAHKDGGCGGPRGAKPPPGARSARFSERVGPCRDGRSEEHTSELQSRLHLVCRLLLE